jgi:hypothetical protein
MVTYKENRSIAEVKLAQRVVEAYSSRLKPCQHLSTSTVTLLLGRIQPPLVAIFGGQLTHAHPATHTLRVDKVSCMLEGCTASALMLDGRRLTRPLAKPT